MMENKEDNGHQESAPLPKLYVRTFCPWCWIAEAQLKRYGIKHQLVSVSADRTAYEEMVQISGQTFAPTLVAGDQVLADFGPEQMRPFLKEVGLLQD